MLKAKKTLLVIVLTSGISLIGYQTQNAVAGECRGGLFGKIMCGILQIPSSTPSYGQGSLVPTYTPSKKPAKNPGYSSPGYSSPGYSSPGYSNPGYSTGSSLKKPSGEIPDEVAGFWTSKEKLKPFSNSVVGIYVGGGMWQFSPGSNAPSDFPKATVFRNVIWPNSDSVFFGSRVSGTRIGGSWVFSQDDKEETTSTSSQKPNPSDPGGIQIPDQKPASTDPTPSDPDEEVRPQFGQGAGREPSPSEP